jgi:non-haem dioxygenase in morphine synthesis N-terminal
LRFLNLLLNWVLLQGYGYEGIGLVAVRNVPGMAELRAKCLPYAYRFGQLPEETKKKYELPEAFYSFGWSHGKEKLEGKPDTAKGSFYFNPMTDRPVDDEKLIKEQITFCHPNIWPSKEDCEGMDEAAKACGRLLVETGHKLAVHCDSYVKSVNPNYGSKPGSWALSNIITEARCHKARLLYYFPYTAEAAKAKDAEDKSGEATPKEFKDGDDFSSWCGWHNDHGEYSVDNSLLAVTSSNLCFKVYFSVLLSGSLTGLTPAMFFDKEGKAIPCPDPRAGLYIRTRQGKTLKAVIPPDCVAYQIGETAQVHTGGILQATPHCVRAAEAEGVSRGTLAVFMEPEWDTPMQAPKDSKPENILRGAKGELMPRGVPPLIKRWKGDEQDFGNFTTTTLEMYH